MNDRISKIKRTRVRTTFVIMREGKIVNKYVCTERDRGREEESVRVNVREVVRVKVRECVFERQRGKYSVFKKKTGLR